MKSKPFALIFIVLFFLSSCNQGEVYYRFHPVKKSTWSRQNSLDFLLDSLSFEPDKKYDVMLEIVNSNRYPYQNIWLTIQQNLTDTAFVSDSVEIKLADSQGKWLGNGSAGLYQLSAPYKTSISLDSARAYFIRIRHGMRENNIVGIEKVGILVK